MQPRVAILYNQPNQPSYATSVEEKSAQAIVESAEAVRRALLELSYPVEMVPLLPPLEQVPDRLNNLQADVVFNLFEGFEDWPETEAAVADIMTELGLRYTGCTGATLSLALDKARSKALMESAEIDTPKCQVLSPRTLSKLRLAYPCIVKPYAQDASLGISEDSVVNDYAALGEKVREISKRFGGRALVEEYVDGREFNITVLGSSEPTPLPISEIDYSLPPDVPRILTFAAKWDPDSIYFKGTSAVCPAEIDAVLRAQIEDAAIRLFRVFDCTGYARVDFRMDNEGQLKALELNPNPDISPNSGAALQASVAGMSYARFIENILLMAMETVTS
jgi:D-alanine-D-alanine ligase